MATMRNCRNSSMLLSFLLATSTLFIYVSSQDNGSTCRTPNGETAKCIPINSCSVIKKAISYFDEDAIKFAKASQCGFDQEDPLVCCGSVGRMTTPAPPQKATMKPITSMDVNPAEPIESSMLPDNTLCGIHPEGSRGRLKMTAGLVEYPWMVALFYDNDINACSGTLINERYVLTTAECLSIDGLILKYARLGEWKFSEDIEKDENDKDAVVNIPIESVSSHPYYAKRSGNNNIALLRLAHKVKYSDFIRPICLPPTDFPQVPPGTIMETSGWSLTRNGSKSDVKQKARIIMEEHNVCQKAFPRYLQRFPNKACARPEQKLCNGESGIPLVKSYTKPKNTAERLEEQWYLEGLISKGFGCQGKEEDPNIPSLYLRVSRYIGWILNNIRR